MKKRSGIFFLISNLFLGTLFPAVHAYAVIPVLLEPVRFMISLLMGFLVLIGISYALLFASNSILAWVTSPNFITIGYTSPENAIVQYGWTVVRDFTNLFFILMFVVIGIATALRISEYEVKKTLPRLIFVILLINFTPMICGLMIDAANILMNFFFTAGAVGMNRMINFVHMSGNILATSARSLLFNPLNLINGVFLFEVLFLIVFNFVASFVLLLYSGLFLVRHVALWILIILSPLAFFCYILPRTRSIWNKWWSQFVQWCFIGVGGGFFLYLAQIIANRPQQIAAAGPGMAGSIAGLLTHSIPLILLLIGMFTTMSTSAMGANVVMGMVKKGGGWVKKTSTDFMKKRTLGAANQSLDRMVSHESKQKLERMASKTYSFGKDEKGIKGWTKRAMAGVATQATRGVGKGIITATGGIFTASNDERMSDASYDQAKKRTSEENIRELQGAQTKAEKAGILRAMSELKQLPDTLEGGRVNMEAVFDAYRTSTALKMKKVTDELNITMAGNQEALAKFATIIDSSTANLSQEKRTTNGLTEKDRTRGMETFQEKVLLNIRRESDLEKIKPNAELMKALSEMTFRNLTDGHQVGMYMRTFGDQFSTVFNQEMASKTVDDFVGVNEKTGRQKPNWLLRAINTTPALAGLMQAPNVKATDISQSINVHKKAFVLTQPPSANIEDAVSRIKTINNEIEKTDNPIEKAAYKSSVRGIEIHAKKIIEDASGLDELESAQASVDRARQDKTRKEHLLLQNISIDLAAEIKKRKTAREQDKIAGEAGQELLKRGIPIGSPKRDED